MGVILDSSVLIAGERRSESVQQILKRVQSKHGESEAALSVVTIVELTHGIYRAKTDADRERRRAFSEELRRDMVVHPVTVEIAEFAGRIEGSRLRKRSDHLRRLADRRDRAAHTLHCPHHQRDEFGRGPFASGNPRRYDAARQHSFRISVL